MNRPEINVTPLIDVLLVLLVIFMVITPTKSSSFAARVPSEPTERPEVDIHPDTLVVSYESDGSIALNRATVASNVDDFERLSSVLRSTFDERERNSNLERTVYIKAPKTLDYGTVAKLIDMVKEGGADPISLQIDRLH